eukprot:12262258-Karenia_brevis.AAC.1
MRMGGRAFRSTTRKAQSSARFTLRCTGRSTGNAPYANALMFCSSFTVSAAHPVCASSAVPNLEPSQKTSPVKIASAPCSTNHTALS